MTTAHGRERSARGSALLDRRHPGWHRKVTPGGLAMQTWDRCVLGMVFGDYEKGRAALVQEEPKLDYTFFGYDHGFLATPADTAALADCWRAEVKARLARDAAAPTAEVAR